MAKGPELSTHFNLVTSNFGLGVGIKKKEKSGN